MPFASANSVQQDLEQGDKITTGASRYATTWHKYTANRCFTACAAVTDSQSINQTQDTMLSSYQAIEECDVQHISKASLQPP